MFKNLDGIMGSLFRVAGPSGNSIKAETYGLSIRNSAGTTLQRLGVGRASTTTDASTYLDLKEKAVLLEFSFAGASPPLAGANTGTYGMCHTSGGLYSAGAIYYDDGSTLGLVTGYKGQLVLTTAAIVGTVSLAANGIYIAQSNTAPFTWTLKGDGAPAAAGLEKSILVNCGILDTSSSTNIPSGAEIRQVIVNVTTGYNIGSAIAVKINGSTPLVVLDTTENDATTVEIYAKDQETVVAGANAGPVLVDISGGPVAGNCKVIVKYVETYLS